MHSKNGKHNFSVSEAPNLKIEPTFGIPCELGALSVTSSPDWVVIIASLHDLTEIAGVELAVKIYLLFLRVRFAELHSAVLGNILQSRWW